MKRLRLTALIPILLANILMLAHAAVPHSHHDGIVCFSLEEVIFQQHCSHQHDEPCCTQSEDNKHHHHGTSDTCDLKDVVMRQDNTHEEMIPCPDCLSLLYTFYTLNEFFLEQPQFEERLRLKPYVDTYISPFVGSIPSLRAPPVSYLLG